MVCSCEKKTNRGVTVSGAYVTKRIFSKRARERPRPRPRKTWLETLRCDMSYKGLTKNKSLDRNDW